MSDAIVYIPPDLPDDKQFAREGIDHLERRGYTFGGVFRSITHAVTALANGASVVVCARQSHWNPALGLAVEFVGDETRRLTWSIPPGDRLALRHHELSEERTVELRRPATVPGLAARNRRRNAPAADLVEQAARRLGFKPSNDLLH